MYKAQSIPNNLNEIDNLSEKLLSRTPSYDSLIDICQNIKIEFEGDGPLGIKFVNVDERLVVDNIESGKVASEFYKLRLGLVVKSINGYDTKFYNYKGMINILNKYWVKESKVTIIFTEDIVYKHLYNFLDNIGCSEYYDKFIELGAKDLSDLGYIEYEDLVKMNIGYGDRKKISKKLGLKSTMNLSKVESEVFDFDSPKSIDMEKKNIELLRSIKFGGEFKY